MISSRRSRWIRPASLLLIGILACSDDSTGPRKGKVDGLVFSAGGVPIEAAGNIVGAVGVSGAATGEQDEACARAGIKAIQMDLEMAGP